MIQKNKFEELSLAALATLINESIITCSIKISKRIKKFKPVKFERVKHKKTKKQVYGRLVSVKDMEEIWTILSANLGNPTPLIYSLIYP